MKKHGLLLFILLVFTTVSQAQLLSDRTNGKVTLGGDLFTDISMGKNYENFNLRSINQGVDVYLTYNFNIAKTKHTVSLGVGFTSHNYFMKNAYLTEPYADTIQFASTPYDYKRSKINANYFDFPIELNFRIRDKFKISLGFKIGILTTGKSKFVGELYNDDQTYRIKYARINDLEKYVYSGTFRIAYRSFNVFAAYQFTRTFKSNLGPEVIPFSIGIGFRAF